MHTEAERRLVGCLRYAWQGQFNDRLGCTWAHTQAEICLTHLRLTHRPRPRLKYACVMLNTQAETCLTHSESQNAWQQLCRPAMCEAKLSECVSVFMILRDRRGFAREGHRMVSRCLAAAPKIIAEVPQPANVSERTSEESEGAHMCPILHDSGQFVPNRCVLTGI